jgi:hypothetical protein
MDINFSQWNQWVLLLLTLGGLSSFLYLLYGGFKWITSGGDQIRVQQARNTITTAIVSLVLVTLAFTLSETIPLLIEIVDAGKGRVFFAEEDLATFINFLLDIIFVAGLALSLIFVIIAGIVYVTSGGDYEKSEKARKTIFNAVIGALIIILFRLLVNSTLRVMAGEILRVDLFSRAFSATVTVILIIGLGLAPLLAITVIQLITKSKKREMVKELREKEKDFFQRVEKSTLGLLRGQKNG